MEQRIAGLRAVKHDKCHCNRWPAAVTLRRNFQIMFDLLNLIAYGLFTLVAGIALMIGMSKDENSPHH